jgi:hypothetical protein
VRGRLLRGLTALLVAAGLTLGTAGCGSSAEAVAGATEVAQLDASVLPRQILGLDVELEDMSDRLSSVRHNAYVEAAGLFSLRRDDVLQATLQITDFIGEAEVDDPDFQSLVVAQIGSTTVRSFRMGAGEVYLSTTQRQSIASWFDGQRLYVLSTREDYPSPRALLREAMEQAR